ncbi:MAG TPA: hypothetical protein VHU40_16915 [Polyangia bacterium]|jgi:hypothetical protein|nr:hypothetical protein [Polyangia bacterium]
MKAVHSSSLFAVLAFGGVVGSCMVEPAPPPPRYASAPPVRYGAPPPGYQQPPPGYQQPPPAPYQGGYANQPPPPPAAYGTPNVPPPPPSAGPCIDPGPQDIPDLIDRPAMIRAGTTTVACTTGGDVDLFLISVPPANAGQVVLISVRGDRGMAPRINVLDANRRPIEQISVGRDQELRAWAFVAGGTSFYLRASGFPPSERAPHTYTLTTTLNPMNEPNEPNDTAEQAKPLLPGRTISAFLGTPMNGPDARNDWYRVDVARDGDLLIDFDMAQGCAPIVKLFDMNRHEVYRQSAGRGERFRFQTRVKRGTYHLQVDSIYRMPEAGDNEPAIWLTRPYTIAMQ